MLMVNKTTENMQGKVSHMTDSIKGNPEAYIGRYGQRRLKAASKWLWDRQGIHAVLGLGNVLLAGLIVLTAYVALAGGSWSGLALLGLLVIPAQMHKTFLRYEETEGASINDHAYVDIGGFHIGEWIGAGLIGAALIVALLNG